MFRVNHKKPSAVSSKLSSPPGDMILPVDGRDSDEARHRPALTLVKIDSFLGANYFS
jgi:hypothetical protein